MAQGYVWSRGLFGSVNNYAFSVAHDAAGNVFVAGHFGGTIDLDPGAGVVNVTSFGLTDVYVCKFTSAGVFSWGKRIGATLADRSFSMDIDPMGNVIISGDFEGTVDFDPGAGVFNLTSTGGSHLFILKLSNAGNFVWAKMLAGDGDYIYGLTTDASSNIIFGGRFNGTKDFDPGAGISNLTTASPVGFFNAFVTKLNSSGNFVWARRFAGVENVEVLSIAADPSGNIYTTGRFSGTVDFDPGAGVSNLSSGGVSFNTFISKLNSVGNFILAKKLNNVAGSEGWGINVDATGNMYIAGWYYTSIDLDPNAGVANRTAVGNRDAYFCRLTSSGNFSWGYSFGSTGIEEAMSVVVDANGNSYLTGRFGLTVDFNPGAPVNNLTTTNPGGEVFVAKFSSAGTYVWAVSTRYISGAIISRKISLDGNNNIHIAGYFAGDFDFNPGAATNIMSSTVYNTFVLKLNNPSPLPVDLLFFEAAQVGNAIALEWATVVEINNAFFTVERSNGNNDWVIIEEREGSGNTNEMSNYIHHDLPPQEGVWYYRLRQTDYNGSETMLGTVSVNYKLERMKFSIFPNPTTGWLTVKVYDVDPAEIKILRPDSRLVEEFPFYPLQDGALLDLSALPKGVYIIQIAGYTEEVILI